MIITHHYSMLLTPHDGVIVNAQLEMSKDSEGRWVLTEKRTGDLSYLHVSQHRLWRLNPGLREALLAKIRAYTLIEGNL